MSGSKSAADLRTPMDLIIKRHPEKKKQIRKYMKKWNKRTTGSQQWPLVGTFDPTCCDEIEAVIKHHKPNDKSDKREGKRLRESEVINWFQLEGKQYRDTMRAVREAIKDTGKEQEHSKQKEAELTAPLPSPNPPPYPGHAGPTKAGQYVQTNLAADTAMTIEGKVEFQPLQGTVKMRVTSEDLGIQAGGAAGSTVSTATVSPYADLRNLLHEQMEDDRRLLVQMEDQRREVDLLRLQDGQRRDGEARRAENDRRYAQELLEAEEGKQRSEEWCNKKDGPLTREELETQRQYAQVEDKVRRKLKSHTATSKTQQHFAPTPAKRRVHMLPEGTDSPPKGEEQRSIGWSRLCIRIAVSRSFMTLLLRSEVGISRRTTLF
ncbi:hypothetical protein SKAU_G00278450 [Synaphobranchus kaupii]|uniref:Uncharacterized protein n=1 Tax=Synaphobranchus kaupii TaxID=118154 RepID=A0A9Q1EWI5_SYNKA|nr:hypothetical protein SKAU_G00278450 [Synaphobranchus kaupii]